jgi:CxxC motif-containing protein (DUF1111 family)
MHLQIKLPERWCKPGICSVILLAAIAISAKFASRRDGVIETRPEQVVAAVPITPPPETIERHPPSAEMLALGRALFLREWRPNDPRGHSGDGLGPVFNESSCVACHKQGGAGGAGPADKNVDIISVTTPVAAADRVRRGQLASIHPSFRTGNSAVLYRFGTEPAFANWWFAIAGRTVEPGAEFNGSNKLHGTESRNAFDTKVNTAEASRQSARAILSSTADATATAAAPDPGVTYLRVRGGPSGRRIDALVAGFHLVSSQRNSTALFGAGMIDGIPDAAIERAAHEQFPDYPQVHGRVSRGSNGRVGKFGWKAQVTSLQEFTLSACAIELGLDVPGHAQAVIPFRPDYRAPGLDMTGDECDALVAFVGSLPAPTRAKFDFAEHEALVGEGGRLFAKVGCTACHSPKLGEVAGIYSDLLLHDMGGELNGDGSYSLSAQSADDGAEPQGGNHSITGARSSEWRTPPLWGVNDSSPYLHDGRAPTLESAIIFHGGEASASRQRFDGLSQVERLKLVRFLESLVAPSQTRD